MSMAELYLASPQEIMKQIYALHASWSSVLVVGHNPGLAMLASMLAGGEVEMPTAATVVFRAAAADWRIPASSESWKLTALWKPREL
jgi:phosphohistidine phosphatase